ncbi:MAG: hypothetical protein F4X64_13110 [Chloroflexi bacterium]|nr:hypothetical protein [Chloroflexota bacterium]
MANWQHCPAVERADKQDGGLWMFKGTDVPLCQLYESLADGDRVDDFAARHGVDVELVAAALRYEEEEFINDLLIRPDGPGEIAAIPVVVPTGHEIPDWSDCAVVERIAGKVSGAWIFTESRLPLWALYSELAGGTTIDEFVDWYSGDKAKVITVLHHAVKALQENNRTAYAYTA